MSNYVQAVFPSAISSNFKPAFNDASAFWNKVIRSGSGGFTFTSTTNAARFCGVDFTYRAGDRITGLDIFAVVEPIDGPGSILGSAGPCAFFNNFPILGLMRFDSADAQGLLNRGSFEEVIIHEMGHVIGIGTVWGSLVQNPCPTSGSCNTNPRYIGRNGIEGFQNLGGSGSVPVANTGGPGTINGHWREDFFNNELMTGFLDNGANPLSIMTVKSLRDLGYVTDTSAAEPYSIPRSLPETLEGDKLAMIGDILQFEGRDIQELEAEQRVESDSHNSAYYATVGLLFIGFITLALLIIDSNNKQRKRIERIASSNVQVQSDSVLPTRK